ncbi:F-box protein At5g50450-like [Impatiens glandulifera]|uniref:F-box protein At5g50450-like n=1 Tax=Impatiens glandulifera TaxID=253017 RepID=UPI001FB15DCA|nr:F-box protein At5g50450-like [Impatiens glandulifera]
MYPRKRFKPSFEDDDEDEEQRSDYFDRLPDDIVISILCKLNATSRCPADFISALITCKKLNRLGLNPLVLSRAGSNTFAIRAKNWCESAHRFFKQCVNAGSIESSYSLGMIRFYCFQNRASGASLMAKAAIKSHAPALYSLAVIQFNGSGGTKNDKDLRAGVALCARAAFLGHIDALRELGHCLQDGYGAKQSVTAGRRLLIQANARELASVIRSIPGFRPGLSLSQQANGLLKMIQPPSGSGSGLVSGSGYPNNNNNMPAREVHPVNRFLMEWFESKEYGPGETLRLCSHSGCGRPETRRNEYRRCSACSTVNYCSRGCQAQDWKLRHKVECIPMEPWIGGDEEDDEDEEEDDVDRVAEIEDGEVVVVAPLALLDG